MIAGEFADGEFGKEEAETESSEGGFAVFETRAEGEVGVVLVKKDFCCCCGVGRMHWRSLCGCHISGRSIVRN